jgi:hypothetical protein
MKPKLQRKSRNYCVLHISVRVCLCVCVRARVSACVYIITVIIIIIIIIYSIIIIIYLISVHLHFMRLACVHMHACLRVCGCGWKGAGLCLRACSLSYPARNADVSYCLLPLVSPNFSHQRLDFRKKVNEHKMCVLIFSTIFISNISHSKKHSARYCDKRENIFT